ncbi:MAG: acyltransferase family protein [Rubrobacteraceae bacterium]
MPKPVESSQRYIPGLDGLRAIAVLAVIAYHLQLGWAQGGLLGVGVFFTLSGYLITDLLLAQRAATGRLRLGDFWLRRARRLLPALFLMLAVVAAWVALLEPDRLPDLRKDMVAAVLYVSNWWNIVQDASYFARFGPPPVLDHLWSLAVEEQFYLLWPFMLWLGLRFAPGRSNRGRYRVVIVLTLVIAALSAVAMALLYQPGADPTRVYEGTDTRAFGLLAGAVLAMVWPSRRLSGRLVRGDRLIVDGAGVIGLGIIALLVWQTNHYGAFLYRGGIVLLSVATVLVVAAVAHPASWLGGALGWGPLRWIGVRSYGIYLWHFPIIVLTTATVQKELNLSLSVLQVGATIAVAALSWRFFEEPIRRGALERLWGQVRSGEWRPRAVSLRSWVTSVGVIGILVLAGAGLGGVISGPAAGGSGLPAPGEASQKIEPSPEPPGESSTELAAKPSTDSPTTSPEPTKQPTTAQAPPKEPPEEPPEEPPVASPDEPEEESQQPLAPEPAPATHTSCSAVAYIGDSTSEGMVSPDYLPDPAQRLDARYAQVGATSQRLEISGARSIVETLPGQTSGEEVARQLMAEGFRGCWVIALGGNDTANVYVGSQVGLNNRIERIMSVVGDQPVLWVSVKTLLVSGPYADENMELWNRTLREACARYPNMKIFDWASAAEDGWFAADGTHFTSNGYAERARLTADSLVRAFPASGEERGSDCVVR